VSNNLGVRAREICTVLAVETSGCGSSFARGYNGPNDLINRDAVRLGSEFQKYSAGAVPDESVRAAQLYLTYVSLHPGPIDGVAGVETLAAFSQFATQPPSKTEGFSTRIP
jgi:hypothetical protein